MRLSIVTPTYNSIRYLEQTIESVLRQMSKGDEYYVVDGGSRDGTVELLKKYSRYITSWVSEPDHGQSDAIMKGFTAATGDIYAWINGDDYYIDGAFDIVRRHFKNQDCDWVAGSIQCVSANGEYMHSAAAWAVHERSILRNQDRPLVLPPQPATFWSKSLWHRVGGVSKNMHYVMDTELWYRMYRSGAHLDLVQDELAALRKHDGAKSSRSGRMFQKELALLHMKNALTPGYFPLYNIGLAWRHLSRFMHL